MRIESEFGGRGWTSMVDPQGVHMAGFVLGLYAFFFLIAFGARIALQLRSTGSTGVVGIGRTQGPVAWLAGFLFVFSIAAGPASTLLALIGRANPLRALDCGFFHALGLILFAAGLAATFWAQLSMGDSWRIGVDSAEKTDLVRRGPFSLVRNPIYSATLVACLGLVLCVPNLPALGSWLIFLAGLELHVRAVEEPHLLRVHGADYARYAAAVGRFVPGVGLGVRRLREDKWSQPGSWRST
jgi:protein-S-isoprenylcysteine O-methyltransferase Ste14